MTLSQHYIQMDDLEFDRKDIQQAFPLYSLDTILGKGSFGKVYLVTHRQTQQKSALKKINCFGMCQYQKKNAVNEVRILASLNHPNIVQLISGMFDSNEEDLYIFMQYAREGDLQQLIQQAKQKKKRIGEALIWTILLNIAEGLQYIHRNSIIHRDIKPANIFRASGGIFKLGDMNVSKIVANGDLAKTKTGSPLYTCPEVWSNKQEGYNQKCDIWSLGIVAYELCCLKVPYEASSIEQLVRKQKTNKLKNIPTYYSAALNEIIYEMLQNNPKKRTSAQKIKLVCLKNLKISSQENIIQIDPLIQTIVIPQTEQRWVNLVPLPPKIGKKEREPTEKRESRDKDRSGQYALANRSNYFSQLQNKSFLIPKSKNSLEKIERGSRIRLPSIQRKNSFHQMEHSREKSREKSRNKSRENTPDGKSVSSSRVQRKMGYEYIKQVKEQIPNL